MRKGASHHFIETGDEFKCDYDWSVISSYLIPIPDEAIAQDPEIFDRLIESFQKCKELIVKAIPKVQEQISELESKDQDVTAEYTLPPITPLNRIAHMKLGYLLNKITGLHAKSVQQRVETIQTQLQLLNALNELTDFLILKPKPVLLKITRPLAPVDRTIFSSSRPNTVKLHCIRRLANAEIVKIHLMPGIYRSNKKNKRFVYELVDAGVQSRKQGTTYFSELPGEENLRIFFATDRSPLSRTSFIPTQAEHEPIFPYQGDGTPEDILNWINEATFLSSEWLKTNFEISEEHEASLAILLSRFFFYHTYPNYYPPSSFDLEFAKKMEEFGQKSPNSIGILDKYIPAQCKDRPVSEMFEVDSISRAPVEWFREAVHQVCPIDAAYNIVKVHESLSVMAVLRATASKQNSGMEDFVEKMPGFDDIFEIWLSLLCINGNPDPQRLMNFIEMYSRFPGFTPKVMASVAYLEASLAQLNSGEEEDL